MSKQRKIAVAFPPTGKTSILRNWKILWSGFAFLEVRQQLSSRLKSGPIKQNLIRFFVSLVWLLMAINWTWSRLQVSFSILTARSARRSLRPGTGLINLITVMLRNLFHHTETSLHPPPRTRDGKFLSNQIEILFYCLNWPIWRLFDGGLAEWSLCI